MYLTVQNKNGRSAQPTTNRRSYLLEKTWSAIYQRDGSWVALTEVMRVTRPRGTLRKKRKDNINELLEEVVVDSTYERD